MREILKKIELFENKEFAPGLKSVELIKYQKKMNTVLGMCMPSDFVELLHNYNGLYINGGNIFGAGTKADVIRQNSGKKRNYLILGYDDFDYLAYNGQKELYQIIDKDDDEVLEECQKLPLALNYILKI